MISWNYVPLLLASLISTYWLYQLSYENRDGMYALLGTAVLAMVFYSCSELILFGLKSAGLSVSLGIVQEWTRVIGVSFTLSAMGMLIRNSKPAFARFPRIFTAIPMLIILSYPFAMDTLVLKDWLMGIYESGALLIAILMYAVLTTYEYRFFAVIPGIIVLAGAFISYWLVPVAEQWPMWLWSSWLSVGILSISYGYRYLDSEGLKPYKSSGLTGQTTIDAEGNHEMSMQNQ
jgi:hypothetical protein